VKRRSSQRCSRSKITCLAV